MDKVKKIEILHCVQYDNYAIFVTLSASEGSQKPKRDFSLRVEMTNTAKMSSRQSGATRDLKKKEQTSKYHYYETIYKTRKRSC